MLVTQHASVVTPQSKEKPTVANVPDTRYTLKMIILWPHIVRLDKFLISIHVAVPGRN